MNHSSHPPLRRGGILFVYLWLSLGFALGTLTLLGPVRWLTGLLRATQASQRTEDFAVRVVILLLIVLSIVSARWLVRRMATMASAHRWRVPAATTLLAGGALLMWMNPAWVTEDPPVEQEPGSRFVFGPYPEREQLEQLKKEGYSGVISLLHPAVQPFEPKLLAREKKAAAAVGIPLIHAPMLPWIGSNHESLARLRALAEADTGRYYVHCYLGKDRVNVVRKLLADVTSVTATAEGRKIEQRAALERGPIYPLSDSVFLLPYPTDEEWFGLMAGPVRQVVSLLDPENPDNTQWIEREQGLVAEYGIPLELLPIRSYPFDPEAALAAANRVRALPHPLLVHTFRTPSVSSEAFLLAYRTGLPPLPGSLFSEPMRAGQVRVIGPNVAVGPRPEGPDFGGFLRPRGVRSLLYVGKPDSRAREERKIATSARLQWQAIDPSDPQLLERLSRGGPWYVYGPGLPAVESRIVARLDVSEAPTAP